MPDFFARLASRAANLPPSGPVVRPRLPQLFERQQPVATEPTLVEPLRWHTTESPPPAVRTDQPRPAPRQAPDQPPPRRPAAIPAVDEPVRHRTVTTVESVSSAQRAVQRLRLDQGPALLPPPVVAPTRIAPETQAPDQPPPVPAPTIRPEPSLAVRTGPVERADLAAGRRHTPEPERVVHISIGRLEVIGGRQEPRSARARPDRPAPLVPLNDYLTGEAGRG